MKEMPERIYLFDCNDAMTTPLEGDTEYIRKDIVDEIIKTAEDHAYFAESEYARKEVIKKVCQYIREHRFKVYTYTGDNEITGWIPDAFIENLKKYMEEQV